MRAAKNPSCLQTKYLNGEPSGVLRQSLPLPTRSLVSTLTFWKKYAQAGSDPDGQGSIRPFVSKSLRFCLPALERHGRLKGTADRVLVLEGNRCNDRSAAGRYPDRAGGGKAPSRGFYSVSRREVGSATSPKADPPPRLYEIDLVAPGSTSVAGSFVAKGAKSFC